MANARTRAYWRERRMRGWTCAGAGRTGRALAHHVGDHGLAPPASLRRLLDRHGAHPGPDLRAGLAAQAAKRVGIRFHPTRVTSWDHRKLG